MTKVNLGKENKLNHCCNQPVLTHQADNKAFLSKSSVLSNPYHMVALTQIRSPANYCMTSFFLLSSNFSPCYGDVEAQKRTPGACTLWDGWERKKRF